MNRTEFENNVANYATQHGSDVFNPKELSNDDYKIIAYVYTWYPTIDNVNGKEQVAMLYCEFGIRIFHDMYATAKKAEALDVKMRKAKAQYEKAVGEWYEFVDGTELMLANKREMETEM